MDDVVRYGIIGTGMMGIEHLWNLHHVDGAQVTALADPSERSLGWALEADEKGADGTRQRTGPAPVTFADHRDLLASGLVDAVVVASPNMTHHDVLVDVLDAGVHVLVEKPLCTTVADCRDVIERAADHPGVVWVGLEYRYMPPVARLITEVHGGAVGRARMIAIREHRFPFLRKVHHWNRFNANTGGTLVEKCCHFFDLMNHLAQATPVRVMASGAQDVNHLDESYPEGVPDILDNAFVIVDYHDGTRAPRTRRSCRWWATPARSRPSCRRRSCARAGVRGERPGWSRRWRTTPTCATRGSITGRAISNTSTSWLRCAPARRRG
jgi:predicted dehydrogenase